MGKRNFFVCYVNLKVFPFFILANENKITDTIKIGLIQCYTVFKYNEIHVCMCMCERNCNKNK